ncbi:MAG: ABC transporter ATP-binding protein [Actinomycetota bacterium]
MAEPAIVVRDLHKSYGALAAVRGIDLEVAEGEVFAMLGPNGAGKTTTVEIMEGHRRRDRGTVIVLGYDPARGEQQFRERIGIVLQSTGISPYLTVAETIEMYRGYYPSPRQTDEVLAVVGLTEKRNDRVRRLSGGQQRRLDVGIGLAGDPDLLFLDEPTTGFDPAARRGAWEMVKGLKDLGKTIFLTTHYMDEAQALADRVAIVADGRIIAEGPPGELAGREARVTMVRFRLPPRAPALPLKLRRIATSSAAGVEIRTEHPTPVLHELTGWAIQKKVALEGLEIHRPSLEDVYLELTREAQEAAE